MDLTFNLITHPDDPMLKEYYKSFDSTFTREDEKEPFEGFQEILAPENQREWAQEFALVASASGKTFGGAQWAAYSTEAGMCVMLSYLHTESHCRQQGCATQVLGALSLLTKEFFNREVDTILLESEPGDAIAFWIKMGFKPLAIGYVAPASQGDHILDHLTLCYTGKEPSHVQLYRYLTTYYWLSYYRGKRNLTEFPQEILDMLWKL